LDWKPVKTGDFFYIPAGTIHAIGPGIQLVEVQQNIDVTYRLYDYGRPRELHLDEAVNVADAALYDMKNSRNITPDASEILLDGPKFRVFQIFGNDREFLAGIAASEWQVVPFDGQISARGKIIMAGECGLCPNLSEIDLSKNKRSLIACNMQ
jgi:mannose-6-phosphate isomerase